MKKIFLRYAGFVPFIALFSCACAQNTGSHLIVSNSRATDLAYTNKAKELSGDQGTNTASINAKAIKDFAKTFKKVENAGWFVIKDGYLAEFTKDGIKTKVFYNRKGRWVGNVRSCTEEYMPRNIRHRVKSLYYDYKINYVQEITVDRTVVYLVKIEDNAFFKTIRIQDGELDEFEVMKKRNAPY